MYLVQLPYLSQAKQKRIVDKFNLEIQALITVEYLGILNRYRLI